jgi:plastocyanin
MSSKFGHPLGDRVRKSGMLTKRIVGKAIGALAAPLILVTMSACGSSGSTASGPTPPPSMTVSPSSGRVVIKTFAFKPNPLRVRVGTDVSWTNSDDILHTVTSGTRDHPDGMFDYQLNGPGSMATFTFEAPGTYQYHCQIHPGMDAVVEVV